MAETFYSILGVDPDADTETIQEAYRDLVKTHHPDVSDDDDAVDQFKRITEARDILVDDASRRQYDRVGHNTYVREHMDSSTWTAHYGSPTGRRPNRANASRASTSDRSQPGQTDGSTGARSTADTNGSRTSGESETAHDYDRYRSEYATGETHTDTDTEWENRSWTEDFDWSPEESESTAGADASDFSQAEEWNDGTATATGYTPSGHESGSTATAAASVAAVKSPIKEIGPWLAFHTVFLTSAFVTVFLLIQWQTTVFTVILALVLLGAAVFFSVLHMISRIYS